MTVLIALLLQLAPLLPPAAPVESMQACREARITGYVRTDPYMNPTTADGTSIFTDEPIVAASYDVPMDSMVWIEGLGEFRVADRGMLSPTHIDVAVWSRDEAFAITSVRTVCIADGM